MYRMSKKCIGFIFGMLLAMLPLGAQEATEPVDLIQRLADRIVAQSPFAFDYRPAAARAEHTYRFDYADLPCELDPNKVTLYTTLHVDRASLGEHPLLSRKAHLESPSDTPCLKFELALSHSPGTLKVRIGQHEFESVSSKKALLKRADYELIHYQHYYPLDAVLSQDRDSLPVEISFQGDAQQTPKFYLAFVEAHNRMNDQGLRLLNPLTPAAHAVFSLAPAGEPSMVLPPCVLVNEPLVPHLQAPLNYTDWRYYTGTFLVAMLDASYHYPELSYSTHVANFFDFFTKNIGPISQQNATSGRLDGPFTLYYRFTMLDDFGPQAAALLEHLWAKHQGDRNAVQTAPWFRYVERSLEVLKKEVVRLPDNTLARVTPDLLTVQSDDLFMAGILLIRAGTKLQRPELIEEAVQQTLSFHNYLFNADNQLYHHAYFTGDHTQSCCNWGRGVGWMMLIYAELLEVLPEDHLQRQQLLKNFRAISAGILAVQGEDGCWHQILDDPNTYYETSATAMFVRAFAAGVTHGWYPEQDLTAYCTAARRGWDALQGQVNEAGEVQGIVRGTPIFHTAQEYAEWGARPNDPRGLGALMWAAMAVDQMQD
ncbi:MAG: hypothetical protein D6772_01695 [Bacteroidetes bacterium]|nr:MAG: hypothetical protein D6772_01695 [Bacteroidota bacterium]